MKQKITKSPKKNVKAKNRQKKSVIKLAHTKRPVLRHLRLIETSHTGKLINHHHTSHLALVIITLIAGILLFVNYCIAGAQTMTGTGSVSVGVVVPGPAPTKGAKILEPSDKTISTNSVIDVSGTCSSGLLVTIYDNTKSVGSTLCTTKGVFSVKIQLKMGENALQAVNYDNINQAGPGTPIIIVTLINTAIQSLDKIINPAIAASATIDKLENPAIIPAITPTKSSCDGYDDSTILSSGGELNVSVVCVIRGIQPNEQSKIGVIVSGGQEPYALHVNLGNSTNDDVLVSVPKPGYTTIPVSYSDPGQYTVSVKAKDKIGSMAITQTIVEVNGIIGLNTVASLQYSSFNDSWLQAQVPIYLAVLALTVGFWIGDIFDRRFGISKYHKLKRKTV